jgi:3,4-dihydroxy 2-butanone 4-phosphate synthase/GTP cyclohydrolase II
MEMIAEEGRGVVIYLRQEGRGIGLASKLKAYNLQDEGYDTVEANLLLGHQADERQYWAAAGILKDLGIESIVLLTNNPAKIEHLRHLGVNVTGRQPVVAEVHDDNRAYLETKVNRMRHMLDLPPDTQYGFPGEIEEQLTILNANIRDWNQETSTRPWVTLSYAQSLDGSIAGPQGAPLRLSGDQSMRLTHALRASHDAILVGVGTVLADDPSLTVRLVQGPNPQPVVLDSHLRTPPDARLLDHPHTLWIATVDAAPLRAQPLQDRGALVLTLPASNDGRVALGSLLSELRQRGVRSLMVEGGAQVLRGFLAADAVDQVVVNIAPRFVGGTPAVAGAALQDGAPLPYLNDATYTRLGNDLIVWATPEVASEKVETIEQS